MAVTFRDHDGTTRLDGDLLATGGTTGDVLTQQTDGTYAPEGGGSLPNPILDPVNIEPDTSAAGQQQPLTVQDVTEPIGAFFSVGTNSDGAGNVDASAAVAPMGTGYAAFTASDIDKDGYFSWYTQYGWEHQPRSDDADATPTFILRDKNGDELIEGRAGATLGFFNHAPAGQQNVPLTTPSVQDVIDALVALGLVEQSD